MAAVGIRLWVNERERCVWNLARSDTSVRLVTTPLISSVNVVLHVFLAESVFSQWNEGRTFILPVSVSIKKENKTKRPKGSISYLVNMQALGKCKEKEKGTRPKVCTTTCVSNMAHCCVTSHMNWSDVLLLHLLIISSSYAHVTEWCMACVHLALWAHYVLCGNSHV